MRFTSSAILALVAFSQEQRRRRCPVDAFIVSSSPETTTTLQRTAFVSSSTSSKASFPRLHMISPEDYGGLDSNSGDSDSDAEADRLKASRLEGNQRQPTTEELKVMDEMITKLSRAQPWELPNAVRRAFRVCSSPQFFLRIASRIDQAPKGSDDKERLSALASNMVSTLEAIVSTTEDQLDSRATSVESILKAASEPGTGEFLVPLSEDRLQDMRTEMLKVDASELDESFLSTVDSWTNKSKLDGMDGMVVIFQKLLQMYAGLSVSRSREASKKGFDKSTTPASELMDKLLETDADTWDDVVKEAFSNQKSSSTSSEDALLTKGTIVAEIQKTMETVVFGLENGSMAQRIQAEYLKELLSRVEDVAP
uniref:Uncharacterized protein n=1 Tax=Grammatophora oceanica TaxID=210454 RepID=A0A7S1UWK8_9STRA|mmetsp:Transcript_27217/g.39869  ORF Transcript_27217/g.39869 Transcript_27217/m.39869 type:complete len:368 (+) Transcript_27217:160-1263(+)|eukprot:CAMPEP_0194029230 /NCGR_PEP_ID=MMETSP0009_2-20130614/3021_1 /TAXON_ID=210454 /ORGANISM="Grammatophora oceanica, Strain CCMP 410" /LENGTH=367 /DNA_ID=CAMNT_0038668841 /DNA_START=207 /DNA_END=1310 /DNA_ORIENTATION=-